MIHDLDAAPACVICRRQLFADELGRAACYLCQDRGQTMLRTMPDLYIQLGDLLQPGAGRGEGRVSGSKTAPLPCSLDVLNLRARGGAVTLLGDWENAVRGELGYTAAVFRGSFEQTLGEVTGFLINNAPWIYASFTALEDFHRELRQLHGHAQTLTTGERLPRRVTVQCDCGATLRVTLDTPGARCDGCGAQYGHTEILQLPLTERNAA